MPEDSFNSKQQFRGRLSHSILITLLPLTLLPILLMSSVVFFAAYRMLHGQLTSQLSFIVDTQSQLITHSIYEREGFLEVIAEEATFSEMLNQALSLQKNTPQFEEARNNLLHRYETASSQSTGQTLFDDFLVLLPDTTILIASQQDWEGLKTGEGNTFIELLKGKKTIASYNSLPFYPDQLILLTAIPYKENRGGQNVTLIGITGTAFTERVLKTSAGIHPKAQAYFVTKDGSFIGSIEPHGMVFLLPNDEQKAILLHDSRGSVPAGKLAFKSFDNQPALAFTKYLPEIEAGLVVELPKTAVAGPLFSLAPSILTILLVTIVLIYGLIGFSARRLTAPLLHLCDITKRFAEGEWQQRTVIKRDDEIGLLAQSFNQMADEITLLYRSMETRVEEQTREMKMAAEVAQIASSAPTLQELLKRTVQLIVERFSYYEASIFLLDEAGDQAILFEAAGEEAPTTQKHGYRLDVGSQSMVGWVTENKLPRIAANVDEDPLYLRDERLNKTRSEVVVPILVGEHLLGALDVQSKQPDAFRTEQVAVLQTVANQVATGIFNARLLEATKINLEEASLLYHATRQIAQAETSEEIYYALVHALKQTSYHSITLAEKNRYLNILSLNNPNLHAKNKQTTWPSFTHAEIETFLPTGNPLIINDFRHPPKIPGLVLNTLLDWKCKTAAFIPVRRSGQLVALFILGTDEIDSITPTSIQPYANLAELTATALEKVAALESMQRRLKELETLNLVNKAVSGQTDLSTTFASIHEAIERSLQVNNFFIALYDKQKDLIHIPYMYESGSVRSIDPFPLGEGLTSILIKSRQALLLVENTEQKSKEMGAKLLGAPAKSWLGVPLIHGDDVLGAMVVQDLENEHRFNEDDVQLLTTTSWQIAAALRNVQLLEQFQTKTERERILHETTRKIRETLDMQSILTTTACELGKTLGIQRTSIVLNVTPESSSQRTTNGKKDQFAESPDKEEGELNK